MDVEVKLTADFSWSENVLALRMIGPSEKEGALTLFLAGFFWISKPIVLRSHDS